MKSTISWRSENADPDVYFRQIAQGHRQGTLRVSRRPHVGEVRVDLAVVFRAADLLWRSQLCGVQHESSMMSGVHAMLDAT